MSEEQDEKERLLKEYREARAELAADLQVFTALDALSNSNRAGLAGSARDLAKSRLEKSRGRYEQAVGVLDQKRL
ncbi:hypothetical protein [Myxococcus virescens]|uniref:Uncharacterized protein n=1 Tax=Myxococcus virescens TaxID=83456 RepID=A0A511HPC3_9BACT|nr:hypothetical protein [Myxococcus virescens]GEL75442.1 hypothetical protein MVI01_72260 [Myxococcus virescens]SDE54047.1 hypothetical protein SAMN04488504_108124 [Myxococcus virescens]